MINQIDYNNLQNVLNEYFKKRNIPSYSIYYKNYLIDFLRYLKYLENPEQGDYPDKIKLPENWDGLSEIPVNLMPKKRIRKILIGEAPPVYSNNTNHIRYFYNPAGPLQTQSPWVRSVKDTLFPGRVFRSKLDFLKACAKEGLILLDLFPFAVKYDNRSSNSYRSSVLHVFNSHTIITLNILKPLLCSNISIGFGLISFGEIILNDSRSINNLSSFLKTNSISLKPNGIIDIKRNQNVNGASTFLRVCGKKGSFGPVSQLLKDAGF